MPASCGIESVGVTKPRRAASPAAKAVIEATLMWSGGYRFPIGEGAQTLLQRLGSQEELGTGMLQFCLS
jgi:hypothetical protein